MACLSVADCTWCRHAGLDCVFAAHDRHFSLCEDLAAFCADPDCWDDAARAERLHRFLSVSVLGHMAEEDALLMPLLRERGLIDEADADAAMIAVEHRRQHALIDKVARQLHRLAGGTGPIDAAALVVGGTAFVHGYRHHIAREDSRLRLYALDLAEADHVQLRAAVRCAG